mmetsp:Transcript_3085/g.8868  ORF Transcript_3085/g.8868 Transcript_3085/m.8868 type:complete len:554 (-) Transcript_3085:1034-2695(-)
MVRLSGLAPYSGFQPRSTSTPSASSGRCSEICRALSLPVSARSASSAMVRSCALRSGRKMTSSSSRLRNSGRKRDRSSSSTRSRTSASSRSPATRSTSASRTACAPTLEVRMMIVFLKLTVRPCPSVMRPSSRTCSSTLKTSGCALSTSSKSTTEYGLRRTASASWPPSSYPTYPGGAPSSRETLSCDMYSDMSIRTIASSESKSASATAFASSVLPTPVGPRNMSDAVGLSGSLSPARERWIASATASTASSCPATRCRSWSASVRIFCASVASIFLSGTPVHCDTTAATSSSPTVVRVSASPPSAAASASCFARSCACSSGKSRYLSSAALLSSYAASACSISSVFCSMAALSELSPSSAPFSSRHRSASARWRPSSVPISARSAVSRAAARGSAAASLVSENSSILACTSRRSTSSSACGRDVASILSFAAASSTRSIALSGRKRSEMYRSERAAAATSAASEIATPWWSSYLHASGPTHPLLPPARRCRCDAAGGGCCSHRSLRPRRMPVVASTVGWATKTCWKRRSSAASFSMCCRYSSSVVAPMQRS